MSAKPKYDFSLSGRVAAILIRVSVVHGSKGVLDVFQQGQVLRLQSRAGEEPLWAYRYRVGGRGAQRIQRGGFANEQDAGAALERALEKL